MTDEPNPRKASLDVTDLEVWEYEGGHLVRDTSRPPDLTPANFSVNRARQQPTSVTDTSWVPAGQLADLPQDSARPVDLAGHPICLARSAGAVHALLDECSHGQVALSEGDVEDGYVECWLHGSRFDLTTGVPTGPPATVPVPVFAVRVRDGTIEVSVPTPGSVTDEAVPE